MLLSNRLSRPPASGYRDKALTRTTQRRHGTSVEWLFVPVPAQVVASKCILQDTSRPRLSSGGRTMDVGAG